MPKHSKLKQRKTKLPTKSISLLPSAQSWQKKHGLIALVVFACLIFASFIYWRAVSKAAPVAQPAKQADSFINTIGVNTHFNYGTYGDFPKLKAALVELGIRNIRDYPVEKSVTKINELNASGIKLTAIMGSYKATGGDYHIDSVYNVVRNQVRDAVVMVEGTNEPDNNAPSGWQTAVRDHQQRLYNKMKGDSLTSNIPVAGPSMTWASNADELGNITGMADLGNMHPYTGGRSEQYRVSEDMAVARQYNVPGKPVVMTETGYHNQIPTDTGHLGTSEAADAVYMPRLYLHYFNLGIPRTFDYEFYDQGTSGAEKRFGWLRNDYSRKPVFHAIKNMIALLKDPGSSFTPGSLSYELTNTDVATKKTLLQKRDGSFWLAVWQQTSIATPNQTPLLNPPNRSLTLNLGSPAASIRTYMPNRGTSVINSASNTSSFSFESSEEVTLIQIGGVAVSPPPPPSTAGQPDLVVTSIVPASSVVGQPVTFQATIKNQGNAATPAGTIHGVAFRVNGVMTSWNDQHTASLAPGASVTLTASGGPNGSASWSPATAGTMTVEAHVDDVNRITGELDETNNKLTKSVTVTAASATTTPGDTNGDAVVNGLDLSAVLTNYGKLGQTKAQGDLNGDGSVNALDLSVVLVNYGK